MPTVFRSQGFRILIWTRDHEPMHVHIFKAEMEVEIYLVDISIKDVNRSATQKFVAKAQELVAENRDFLIAEWERIKPIP